MDDPEASNTPARGSGADRIVWTTLRRGGPWLVALAVSALVLTAVDLAMPAVLGRAVDAALGLAPRVWLAGAAAAVVVLVAGDAADDLASGAATARSTAALRRRVLRHVLALGTRVRGRFAAGDLAARLGGNAADVGRVSPRVVGAAASLLTGAGATVALALIDPWLCVTFLAAVPVLAGIVRGFSREVTDVNDRYLQTQGQMAGSLVDALSGARTIAAAGTEDRESRRVLRLLPELHRRGVEMWRVQARMATKEAVLVPLLEVSVLGVGGLLLARGRITPGELLAAVQYVALATALGSATDVVGRVAQARAAAGRVDDVLSAEAMAYGTEELPPGGGRLELRGVGVRIGGRQVLDGIDLVVPAGSLVAVAGRSGAGKSLLAAVAGRLVDPDEGEVLLDGMPLRLVSRACLRRAVGYGFEQPALFGATVAGAIAFGEWEPQPAEVAGSAWAAQAHGFIERLPRSYATPLPEAPMSGGERQRVGLARAFAHADRLLVLDDVVASLDTVTERSIVGVLTGELGDRTRLIVAHRASTAARADTVVWLENGRIRSSGPHRELWREAGYRALFVPEEVAAANRASGNGAQQ